MSKKMTEEMACNITEALGKLQVYKEGYAAELIKRLVVTPVNALQHYLGLGPEYLPYVDIIRSKIEEKYKQTAGHDLLSNVDVNAYPEGLRTAVNDDPVLLKHIGDTFKFFIEHNNKEIITRVAGLMSRTDKENIFCGGLNEAGFHHAEWNYLKKFPKELYEFFTEMNQNTAEEQPELPMTVDKVELVKRFYELTTAKDAFDKESTDVYARLEKDGVRPEEILANRHAIETANRVAKMRIIRSVEMFFELTDRVQATYKELEKVTGQLKESGLDPEKLLEERASLETAMSLLAPAC